MLSYATSLYDRGDYAGSAAQAREVLALRGKTLTDEHVLVAGTLLYLGRSLDHLGRFKEAERTLRECLELRRKYLPRGIGSPPRRRACWASTSRWPGSTRRPSAISSGGYQGLVEARGADIRGRSRPAPRWTGCGGGGARNVR